jgi:hypothetical protein
MTNKKKNRMDISDEELDKMYLDFLDSLGGGSKKPRGMSDAEYQELMKSKTRLMKKNKKTLLG